MTRVGRATFWWRIRINARETWRDKLGLGLQRLATAIDGRLRFAIDLQTLPPLSARQRAQCIAHSFGDLDRCVREELRHDAFDRALQQLHPELFRESSR